MRVGFIRVCRFGKHKISHACSFWDITRLVLVIELGVRERTIKQKDTIYDGHG